MPTMAEAIREALSHHGGKASREEIKGFIEQYYSGVWQEATLRAHLYACVVNNAKAYIHHPSTEKFLFRRGNGDFEFYDQAKHGENVWLPTEEDVAGVEEVLEASISLERDLETYLAQNLPDLEPALTLVDRQVKTEVGIMDILARDREGRLVAIELKVGEAKDSAVGQVAGYLGSLKGQDGEKQGVRAILVASEFSDRVRMAASVIPGLSLVTYKVSFQFSRVQ